jgi:hypothetical protein
MSVFKSGFAFIAMVVAFGLVPRMAHAEFLVQVSATLTTPTGVQTINNSTLTIASNSGTSTTGNVDLLSGQQFVRLVFGTTTGNIDRSAAQSETDTFSNPFSWTLQFSHIVSGSPTGTVAEETVQGNLSNTVARFQSNFQSNNVFTTTYNFTGKPITVDGRLMYLGIDNLGNQSTTAGTTLSNFGIRLYANAIPEPSTIALLGVGLATVLSAPLLRRLATPKP